MIPSDMYLRAENDAVTIFPDIRGVHTPLKISVNKSRVI